MVVLTVMRRMGGPREELKTPNLVSAGLWPCLKELPCRPQRRFARHIDETYAIEKSGDEKFLVLFSGEPYLQC